MVNVLADITGPGALGLHNDPQNFLIVSAFLTSCFVLLNTFWGVVWFHAWDEKKWFNIFLVVASHLFVSLMTLLNSKHQYLASLVSAYITMVVMGALAFKTAGGSLFNIYKLFSRKTRTDHWQEPVMTQLESFSCTIEWNCGKHWIQKSAKLWCGDCAQEICEVWLISLLKLLQNSFCWQFIIVMLSSWCAFKTIS